MSQTVDEEKNQECLVIGTESGSILILESTGMEVKQEITIPSVAVFFCVEGTVEVDCKIFVACRDGNVYCYSKEKLNPAPVISIDSKPLGMIKMERTIILAGMDNAIHSFYLKGKKNFSVQLKTEIVAIEKLQTER
jgi:hypothetical protein